MSNTKISLRGSNGKIYYGWIVVLLGFIFMIFGYSCLVSVAGMFVLPINEELGIPIGDFTMWMTFQGFAAIATLLVIQKKFTKKAIRPIMAISAVAGAIGMIGFARATELWHFYAFAVLFGVCMSGLTSTPCTVLTNNWFGSEIKGVALSIIFGGTSIGVTLITPVLNMAMTSFGWRGTYIFIAVCLLVCAPLCFLMKWGPEDVGVEKMGLGKADMVDPSLNDETKAGVPFSVGIKKPSTWLMLLSCALVVVCSVNILLHTTTWLVMSGFEATVGATITSIALGMLFIGSIVIGAICDRGHLQFAAILTALLFAAAYVGQLFIPQIGMGGVAILIIGYGFGCPAVNVISPLLVNHMFGEKEVGRYVSCVNMFISLGAAVGATIVGAILNTTGTYTAPFLTCAGLLVLCAIIRGTVTSKKSRFDAQ